jgi:hypothetical protein
MFKNSNFGSKWFYAFLTDIKYINVNMCEVSYETDVYQTWMFDITIHPSFVVREHVDSDTMGEHIVDEGLETGDYITKNSFVPDLMGVDLIVIGTTIDTAYNPVSGNVFAVAIVLSFVM